MGDGVRCMPVGRFLRELVPGRELPIRLIRLRGARHVRGVALCCREWNPGCAIRPAAGRLTVKRILRRSSTRDRIGGAAGRNNSPLCGGSRAGRDRHTTEASRANGPLPAWIVPARSSPAQQLAHGVPPDGGAAGATAGHRRISLATCGTAVPVHVQAPARGFHPAWSAALAEPLGGPLAHAFDHRHLCILQGHQHRQRRNGRISGSG